jgi:2Fe-2S ferredoxin
MDAIVHFSQPAAAGTRHFIIEEFKEIHILPNITYIEPSGQAVTLSLPTGWNLMQGATANGVDGILGECGGSCACATCHCYVEESRLGELPQPSEGELAMLTNVASERRPNSRLACQIKVSDALEGLVVTLPPTQE